MVNNPLHAKAYLILIMCVTALLINSCLFDLEPDFNRVSIVNPQQIHGNQNFTNSLELISTNWYFVDSKDFTTYEITWETKNEPDIFTFVAYRRFLTNMNLDIILITNISGCIIKAKPKERYYFAFIPVKYSSSMDQAILAYIRIVTNNSIPDSDIITDFSHIDTNNFLYNFTGKIYHVSQEGDDAFSGTAEMPFKSIYYALQKAEGQPLLIKVAAGVYYPGNGLLEKESGLLIEKHNVILSGGWDPQFRKKIGFSELDGQFELNTIIKAGGGITNILIEGFEIRNSTKSTWNDVEFGGGITFRQVSYSMISNVIISNNVAYNYGGGFYDAGGGGHNTIFASITGNKAGYSTGGGGGIYLNSDYNTIIGLVSNNQSVNAGGGGIFAYHNHNTIYADIVDNTARYGGGLCMIGDSNNIYGMISGNIATDDGGGGVYLNGSGNTFEGPINNNISLNKNSFAGGGGIYFIASYSSTLTINGLVSGNISTNFQNAGGGIYYSLFAGCTLTTNGTGIISNNIPDDIYYRP